MINIKNTYTTEIDLIYDINNNECYASIHMYNTIVSSLKKFIPQQFLK